jgi:hypothetical protein
MFYNLAAERRQKMRETPGEIVEPSWLRLQEGVPLCKSGMAKKEALQENSDPGICGSRKELAVARREMTHRAGNTIGNVARRPRIGRMLGGRQLMRQEGANGSRNRDVEEQLRLGNERTTRGIYRKSTGLLGRRRVGE